MKRIVWLLFAASFSFILTADSYYGSDVWPKNRFVDTSPVPITSTYSPSNHNSNLGYGAALIDRMRSYKHQQTILHDYQSQTYNDLAYEQKYTLSEQTKTYIKKQGFSKKIWTQSLYGTKQQQQLHASFILLTEKAVLKIYTQSHAHDLYQSVIDHAAAGCLATRANNIDLAYSLHTFCIALFDCAELVTSAILNGTKSAIAPILHPIQTTQEIISDIELIAECTVDLVNRAVDLASVRTKNDFELWKQKQTHDIEKLYTILCDEWAQITPRGIIQTLISSSVQSLLSVHLFGALSRFAKILKKSKSNLIDILARTKKPKDFIVTSTAEGIPITISQKITEFFKVTAPGTDVHCACPPNRGLHKHPNGIYQDAPYHQRAKSIRSTSEKFRGKSPSPFDGQLALDVAQKFNETSTALIGASKGQIVMLKKTRDWIYHGYVMEWDELYDNMRKALQKAGITNDKGIIIKKDLL